LSVYVKASFSISSDITAVVFSFLFFLGLLLTTEAMGIWRSAGEFPVAKRQKEMRAQRLLNARQPACAHRRVLPAGRCCD